ncbi:energy transducer TonB [Glaciimonas soli]|uniref:Protein TonB n=1 Tax=Glaciimonas soli TaxID=2590999 RepID=A0A843YYN7_9BURK|nr:energy transducer TonB [Glaciimonas soli]MQR01636.1 TonB family protein [Glaciimonas soli]
MDFAKNGESPGKNFTGIALVILLHVVIIYALLTGLARKVVEVIQKPVETVIVPEIKPDIPPPPPKPKPKMEVTPKTKAPPPPFVPPPEVKVNVPVQPTIAAVSHDAPPTHDLPPPSAEQPSAKAAPSNTAPTAVSSTCAKPEYPRQSLQDEEEGIVTLSFLISAQGKVVKADVAHSSGFKALDRAALNALSQCTFKPGTVNGEPQESSTKMQYVWKLE